MAKRLRWAGSPTLPLSMKDWDELASWSLASLSIPSHNILAREHIFTLGDLLLYTADDLGRLAGIGGFRLDRIKTSLAAIGLALPITHQLSAAADFWTSLSACEDGPSFRVPRHAINRIPLGPGPAGRRIQSASPIVNGLLTMLDIRAVGQFLRLDIDTAVRHLMIGKDYWAQEVYWSQLGGSNRVFATYTQNRFYALALHLFAFKVGLSQDDRILTLFRVS